MRTSSKIGLSIAFLSLAIAAFTAANTPAVGYELSIYTATPRHFWLAVSTVLAIGVIGGIVHSDRQTGYIFVGATVAAILLVVSLPYLRGYYFIGQFDMLQHLGHSLDLAENHLGRNPYPGIHFLGIFLSFIGGLSVRDGLMLGVTPIYLVFILSLPFIARQFQTQKEPGRYTTIIPLLLGVWVPPIIAVVIPRMQPLPTVMGMFVLIFVLGVAIKTSQCGKRTQQRYNLVLIILTAALVFYHPQQSLISIAVFSVFVLPLVLTKLRHREIKVTSRAILIMVCAPTIVLLQWITTRYVLEGALFSLVYGIIHSLGGVSSVSPPSSPIQQFGGSTLILLGRALSIPILVGCLAAIGIFKAIHSFWGNLSSQQLRAALTSTDGQVVRYATAFLPCFTLAGIYIAAGDMPQVTRYLAIVVALGTPIAGLELANYLRSRQSRQSQAIVAALIIIGALVALPTVFASPYLYYPNQQVSAGQMAGYDHVYSNTEAPERTQLVTVDTDAIRHYRALYGTEEYLSIQNSAQVENPIVTKRGENVVAVHFDNRSLTDGRADSYYLMSTAYARQQHTDLYKGIRFTETDFAYLSESPGIRQVYDNGDARLYYIDVRENSTDTSS